MVEEDIEDLVDELRTGQRRPRPESTVHSGRVWGAGGTQRQSIFEKKHNTGNTGKKKEEWLVNLEKEPWLTLPLMMGPGGQPMYQPYKIRDLDALVKQLPPITEGGAAWLRKLKTLTEGEELAIGDFRAIGA